MKLQEFNPPEKITHEGKEYTPIRPICRTLGIDFSGQLKKLKAMQWASVISLRLPDEHGRHRQYAAIEADALPVWLATISSNKTNPESCSVYFVQCEATGLIKIGISVDMAKRFRMYVTMNSAPVKCLKVIEGGRDLEGEIHSRFAHLRHHGEWFRPGPDLMAYIDDFDQESN